jgi:hypothetical protein
MEFGPQPKQAAEESLKDLPRVKILLSRIANPYLAGSALLFVGGSGIFISRSGFDNYTF